ncbi:MAG: hypothetical protein FWF85_06175 [Clostridiales bacterium]|jgi:hypothetical protein|nr:hypothetical protein [Clostridiales bacterium]MDR2712452.1 hypothetical protein [Clostridiales bacterium]
MKKTRIICWLLVLLLLSTPLEVKAETRSIYVGDIVTLEINSNKFSPEQLREKFQAFDILEIKSKADGYLLSLRSFEVGEQIIVLGDKEIIINVASTLDEIKREDIFAGDMGVTEPGFSFSWRLLFYLAAAVFALSGIFFLFKILKKRKIEALSPHQLFLRRCSTLSEADDKYFVSLTFYFKKYLESLYSFQIIGKTSREIVAELKEIEDLSSMLLPIGDWLNECDRMKFTGAVISAEERQQHYGELLDLVEKIDGQKEGAA